MLISGMAAMYDPQRHSEPRKFRPDRSYWGYLNYGYQMHYCVAWDISNIIMLEYFRALLLRKLERKPAGRFIWRGAYPWRIDARYRKV